MKYDGYLFKVTKQIDALFANIAAHYNFDYGDEFEIALCHVLRQILPQKYGVCRGFVVAENGDFAGDDIIIYEKDSSPTLRLLPQDLFERKNYIPVEAVYAYIEAKHTLSLTGTGEQSLHKAWSQVAKVKQLLQTRQTRSPLQYDKHLSFSAQFSVNREGWPEMLNPPFGAIISLQVRQRKGSQILKADGKIPTLMNGLNIDFHPEPDLIIAGTGNLVVPCPTNSIGTPSLRSSSPFYQPGQTELVVRTIPNHAFAVGICTILWALDTMRLGPLPWDRILEEGLNVQDAG